MQLEKTDPIKATASWTTIAVIDRLPPGTKSIIGDEPPDNLGLGEDIAVPVDFDILNADRELWPQLYLDWFHCRLLELARARAWDEAPLEFARQGCLDDGLQLRLQGKLQTSPDRRHKARLDWSIDDDGRHQVTLNIFDKTRASVGQTRSSEPPANGNLYDFRKSAQRLYWGRASTVRTIQGSCVIAADLGVFQDTGPAPNKTSDGSVHANPLPLKFDPVRFPLRDDEINSLELDRTPKNPGSTRPCA